MLSSLALRRRPKAGPFALGIIFLLMALILAFLPLRSQAQDEPEVFRPAKFVLIEFDLESLPVDGSTTSAMLGLASSIPRDDIFGELGEVEKPEVRTFNSIEEVRQELHSRVRQPSWLPGSISGRVADIVVVEASSAEYTVDLAKVDAVSIEIGVGPLLLPPELDGAIVLLDSPAKVILAYGADADKPDLFLGQMQSPSLTVPGEVNVEAARLALIAAMPPGLQPLARQLEAVTDWRNTVPVVVPPDVDAIEVDVSGAQGVMFSHPDGADKVLIWSDGDRLFGLVGSNAVSYDDMLRIASSVQ